MMAEDGAAALTFSARNRTLAAEDEIELTSAGIDIGSSTSHLVISRIVMERRDTRYVVGSRELVFESALTLTPYSGGDIDAATLRSFIDAQYAEAGVAPAAIDVGALILTGVAARRRNARAIADALAIEAGNFIAVSAGDRLETTLAAHGAGAVALSRDTGERVMVIDVGGGTSKIAVCERGEIVARNVVDVGARLLRFDENGALCGAEAAARLLAAETRLDCSLGRRLAQADRSRLAEQLADRLFQAVGAAPRADGLERWLRTGPLQSAGRPDVLMFSGGVAEYLYGRETRDFGDLGPALAAAVASRAQAWGVPVREPTQAIRATVLGASQYTLQLSGSTIFVSPAEVLPLRNVVAIRPKIDLGTEAVDAGSVRAAIRAALDASGLDQAQTIALCFDWQGSASYPRLDAFCVGALEALEARLGTGQPLVIVTEADVGGLIGAHLRAERGVAHPVVSIDGISLGELDFLDVGALLESTGAVPVVVKSLLF